MMRVCACARSKAACQSVLELGRARRAVNAFRGAWALGR